MDLDRDAATPPLTLGWRLARGPFGFYGQIDICALLRQILGARRPTLARNVFIGENQVEARNVGEASDHCAWAASP
jgi:hypothetical protein